METEKISVLLTTLDEGTLSGAADRMGYTPSGISRAISSLEEEVGFPLLSRTRQGVTATDSCLQLMPAFRRILSAEQSLRQEAQAIAGLETGTLVIGNSYSTYYRMLAELISGFVKDHPGIHVETLEGSSSELKDALEENRCDLCIISRREGSHDWIPLMEDELVAVFADNDLSAAKPSSLQIISTENGEAIALSSLAKTPFIEVLPGQETDNSIMFRRNHIAPDIHYSCRSFLGALSLAEAELGFTIVNRVLLDGWQGNTRCLPLYPPQKVEIGIAVHSLENASPAAQKFIVYTREKFREKQ